MRAFGNLQAAIGRGMEKSVFRYPGRGGGYGGYGGGYGGWGSRFGGPWGLVPGSDYDYARAAGITWLNGIVMTALGWICRAWPEAKMVIHRPRPNDKPEVITDHPALALLANPNEDYDDSVLTAALLLSMVAGDGNGYLFKQRASAMNVTGLEYIPHFLIAPLYPTTGRDFISGYRYWVDGEKIDYPESEIVHLRNPGWAMDPGAQRKAIPPLAGELRSIANDNEERSFSSAMLRNMGWPGALLSPKDPSQSFTAEQNEQLKRGWRDRVSGENRGMPFASTIPIDVHAFAFSPEQLATDSLARMNIARICAAIGLDPLVLGLPSDSKTYANLESARKGAYENLLIPLQSAIDSQLTMQLMHPDRMDILGRRRGDVLPGDRFARDYSGVACLQEASGDKFKRLSVAVGGPWLTPNEARQEVGFEEIEGGDELRQPQPIGGFGQGNQDQTTLPRAASLSLQREIGERWRKRRELAAANGNRHG